jgi:glyoxylase-like metal-dependent hydrolase (beta-lactamase superfamily II)
MIRTERHGDVVRFEFLNRRSRLMGLSVSAYLVRGVLVDSGFPAVVNDLLQAVRPNDLRGALITHSHEDHAGNVEMLASLGVPIGLSPATRSLVSAPRPLAPYRRWTWGSPRPLISPVAPFSPDDLELVHTPGHSGDHHVVWDPTSDTVFGADLFLGVKVRVAHPGEDIRQSIDSIRSVTARRPQRFFDAHRGLVSDPIAALTAKADWMEATVSRIDDLHHAGTSEDAILREVMGRDGFVDWVSGQDYSRRNFVRSVIATHGRPLP